MFKILWPISCRATTIVAVLPPCAAASDFPWGRVARPADNHSDRAERYHFPGRGGDHASETPAALAVAGDGMRRDTGRPRRAWPGPAGATASLGGGSGPGVLDVPGAARRPIATCRHAGLDALGIVDAPGPRADPRPGEHGVAPGRDECPDAQGLADQPGDRPATGGRPPAGHRRGDRAGPAGAGAAAPGQGAVDPRPQRRRRLLPPRRRPAEHLHRARTSARGGSRSSSAAGRTWPWA